MKSYVNEAFSFHVGKQHGGLFDATIERRLGYGRYSEAGAVKEIGRCTVIDADGDKLFDEYGVELTRTNDKSLGRSKGTGKYSIRATLTVTAEAWPELGKTDTMRASDYNGE
jgi:hypothetical protein